MIFGSRAGFALELRPVVPNWERRSPTDRGPWAALTVWSGGVNLTEAVSDADDQLFDALEVPLLPIARWLCANAAAIAIEEFPATFHTDAILHEALELWNEAQPADPANMDAFEDRRYEWYTRHFLLAGAEGSMLPDLAFARVDGQFHVTWRQPEYPGVRRVRFVNPGGAHRHPFVPSWSAVCGFIEYVSSQCGDAGNPCEWLHPAACSLESLSAIPPRDFLRLVSPEAAALLDGIALANDTVIESSPVLLALRDTTVVPGACAGELLTALRHLIPRLHDGRRRALDELRALHREAAHRAKPEAAGTDAANSFRHHLGLNGQPLDTAFLETRLDEIALVHSEHATDIRNSFVLGAPADGAATVAFLEHPRLKRECARRMEMARAIGHLILDPPSLKDALGAASSITARGPRRRRSGAFAAELLMPEEGIRKVIGSRSPEDPNVFGELLDQFGVGARTAAFQLWNKQFIGYSEQRDALIDEFSWKEHASS